MKVIASVEKYENAGMQFSTVPAFALAECRASDACCLFLVQHTRAKSACFPPQESSEQVAHSGSDLELHTWRTHSLDPRAAPVPFPRATCRPPPTLFFLAPISLHAHWAHGHSNLGWPRAIWTASVRVGFGNHPPPPAGAFGTLERLGHFAVDDAELLAAGQMEALVHTAVR